MLLVYANNNVKVKVKLYVLDLLLALPAEIHSFVVISITRNVVLRQYQRILTFHAGEKVKSLGHMEQKMDVQSSGPVLCYLANSWQPLKVFFSPSIIRNSKGVHVQVHTQL